MCGSYAMGINIGSIVVNGESKLIGKKTYSPVPGKSFLCKLYSVI
jgi:hypothetical protein